MRTRDSIFLGLKRERNRTPAMPILEGNFFFFSGRFLARC